MGLRRKNHIKNKLLVIVGPTASGKTALAIKLAKKFKGEVVSADSRQIYQGMDIGTAKPLPKRKSKNYIVQGIKHWLIDIKKPNQNYTVAQYKKDAIKIIKEIQKRNKLPILVGGTGLYVKSVVENLEIPKVKANPQLRKKLEKELQQKGLSFLFKKLSKLDPEAAYIVDPKNPRRVIRALEIILVTKKPFSSQRKKGPPLFSTLQIGISLPKEKLKKRINCRVERMIKKGLVKEVQKLIKKYGFHPQAFDAIGYREIIDFLKGKISLKEAIEYIKKNTFKYAKRQLTWFRKDKTIHWITTYKEAEKLVKEFIKN